MKQYLSIENEDYIQEPSNSLDKQKEREDFYLKIDKVIIENGADTTNPLTIGKVIGAVQWASGPFLTKIQLGNLDQQEYSNQLSQQFKLAS